MPWTSSLIFPTSESQRACLLMSATLSDELALWGKPTGDETLYQQLLAYIKILYDSGKWRGPTGCVWDSLVGIVQTELDSLTNLAISDEDYIACVKSFLRSVSEIAREAQSSGCQTCICGNLSRPVKEDGSFSIVYNPIANAIACAENVYEAHVFSQSKHSIIRKKLANIEICLKPNSYQQATSCSTEQSMDGSLSVAMSKSLCSGVDREVQVILNYPKEFGSAAHMLQAYTVALHEIGVHGYQRLLYPQIDEWKGEFGGDKKFTDHLVDHVIFDAANHCSLAGLGGIEAVQRFRSERYSEGTPRLVLRVWSFLTALGTSCIGKSGTPLRTPKGWATTVCLALHLSPLRPAERELLWEALVEVSTFLTRDGTIRIPDPKTIKDPGRADRFRRACDFVDVLISLSLDPVAPLSHERLKTLLNSAKQL